MIATISMTTARSIPACAGEPTPLVENPSHGRVYPRVCGGTGRATIPRWAVPGLSPRVRGNRRYSPACLDCPRSIPACAGEPLPH